MKKIGFVGVGHMGGPMAKRLVEAGYDVTVFDLSADAVAALMEVGAASCGSIDDLAKNDLIITMLQTGEQVRKTLEAIFSNAKPDSYFIDCSSIDVGTAQALHRDAKERGFNFLDAPVSGGVKGATQGTLTIMVGGDIDTLDNCRPVLNLLGKNIIHAGIAGCGQVAKICNNMILGVSMIAVSEAFVLAKRLNLSPDKLFEICTKSSGRCWALDTYCPEPGLLDNVPSNNDYEPGFMAKMMLKDLNLSQSAAELSGITTPMGQKAHALYKAMVDAGHGELDFSAIIKELEN